jgi:catechol 2,3-dioxygenase-like lactoylglutathione lyase family enzyme
MGMFEAIDRVVVAVEDLDTAKDLFSDLLDMDFDEPLVDEQYNMRAVYSCLGLELVESTAPGSVIDNYIKSRGEGVFRVVIKVTDMEEAVRKFEEKGVRSVGELTIGGVREIAFHPKDAHGIQIVLAEYKAKHPATVAALEK